MKRVLIVSPHFPPLNAPDFQRVRMSLPYYRAAGWEPVVLAVDERDIEGVIEPELLTTVPPDVRVVRCRAWPVRWTRRVGVGSLALRAWRALDAAGSRLLREQRFDLVLFSNTQFPTFTLGRRWRRRFGVPYVLDVQDPWRTDYYQRPGARKPPGGWKYQFARLQAALLEGWTFRRAAGVISVSERYVADLRARYPEVAWPAEVIPFGASRADLAAALAVSTPPAWARGPGEVHFVYTGAAGPITPHATTVLFEALRRFRIENPTAAARLRFHFLGTSYVAPGRGRPAILPIAETCGVADLVDEVPHRLGHLEAIRLQAAADVLLLPGSSDLAYSASKIYPYYLARRPILAVVFRGSVMERVLEELRCATLVRISETGAREPAYAAIGQFFSDALAGFPPGALPERNDARFEAQYLAETLTQRQAALFERAVSFATAAGARV